VAALRLVFGSRDQVETVELPPGVGEEVTEARLRPFTLLTQADLDVINSLNGVGEERDGDSDTECDAS
jgi:hypothetical protein